MTDKTPRPDVFLHSKSGRFYEVLDPGPAGAVLDCTNGPREGRRMVVYRSCDDGQLYVRDEDQFKDAGRFVPVPKQQEE